MDGWAWTNEEEPPFPGLPPLPKVFREPSLPSLPETKGHEETKPVEGRNSSHQGRLAWLHGEMLKLRLIDVGLFNQLYLLALEIQDLRELQQETESFFKEDEMSQGRGPSLPICTHAAAPFELSI